MGRKSGGVNKHFLKVHCNKTAKSRYDYRWINLNAIVNVDYSADLLKSWGWIINEDRGGEQWHYQNLNS